ncbi:MAG: efflux RND transporter periplasmic adaptor subunit [Phenylobacterium sp.]|uniref:efflux RND transporter periplasmic adaptor subunit n=1 Tax=Phenylobacterium sp. TaxID=1871053 RepID=UPI00391E0302
MRRHFFLAGAIVALILMVLVGGWKLTLGKKEGPGAGGGPAMAQGGPPGGGGGRGGPGGPGGGMPVSVTAVEARTFIDSIDVIGVAKGRQSVTLTAAATQLVERVRFSDGQQVARGAVLVELKGTEQNAALAQAQARLVQAEREFQRWRTLADQGFASKAALDEREAAYLSARADVDAARARQADRVIRAPFAGVVGLTDIAPGALINPGAPIVTLDDISTVRVDFEVPDRYLAALREGQPIYARADAYPGETIQGRIAKLDTRIDERTRSITARAEFPNPGGRLKPGMMLRVSIAQGQRQNLAIPEAALSVQGDSAFVYVLNAQGERTVAEQRPVRTGARQEGFVEVLDGLRVGERLVADGLNKIQPGQPVQPLGARQANGAPGAGTQGPRPPA